MDIILPSLHCYELFCVSFRYLFQMPGSLLLRSRNIHMLTLPPKSKLQDLCKFNILLDLQRFLLLQSIFAYLQFMFYYITLCDLLEFYKLSFMHKWILLQQRDMWHLSNRLLDLQ